MKFYFCINISLLFLLLSTSPVFSLKEIKKISSPTLSSSKTDRKIDINDYLDPTKISRLVTIKIDTNQIKKDDLPKIQHFIITIANKHQHTIYNKEKIDVYKLNHKKLIYKKIKLNYDYHRLIEFLIVDKDNNVLYFCPKTRQNYSKKKTVPMDLNLQFKNPAIIDIDLVSSSVANHH